MACPGGIVLPADDVLTAPFNMLCGGGVDGSACCPGVVIPKVLYLKLSGGITATYVLNYTAIGGAWAQSPAWVVPASGPCFGFTFKFSCWSFSSWALTGALPNGDNVTFVYTPTGTCSPFSWTANTTTNILGCGGGSPVTITITAANPGGGIDCFTGACGLGVSSTLTATTSGRAGIFTSFPASFTLSCTTVGGDHIWIGTPITYSGGTVTMEVVPIMSGGVVVPLLQSTDTTIGCNPDAGFVCFPFAAVYHVGIGGDTMVVTVTG